MPMSRTLPSVEASAIIESATTAGEPTIGPSVSTVQSRLPVSAFSAYSVPSSDGARTMSP